jgi:hypothetical protein
MARGRAIPKASKICSRCKQDKPRIEFFARPDRRHLVQSICKVCSVENAVIRASTKRKNNKEYSKLLSSRSKIHNQKNIEELSDWYVQFVIKKQVGGCYDVSKELIDLKREQLKISRFIKGKQNEKC